MRWKKPLVSLTVLLLATAAAEGAYRGYLAANGRSYSAEGARQEIRAHLDYALGYQTAQRKRFRDYRRRLPGDVLNPFYGFDFARARNDARDQLERQRNTEDVVRVMILGGSVAARFSNQGDVRLTELLESDPRLQGREVELLRHGHASYKQPQQLTRLAYLLSFGIRPDLVIELDGYNEVAIGCHNARTGAHPSHPDRDIWLALAIDTSDQPETVALGLELRELRESLITESEAALEKPLLRSALFGGVLLAGLERHRSRISEGTQRYVGLLEDRREPEFLLGPSFEGDDAAAARTAADLWYESSVSMDALCAARGIAYLHLLQPALHDEGMKPLTPQELESSKAHPAWIAGVQLGYPLLREHGARLQERGIAFLDLSSVFADVTETMYVDPVHFGRDGSLLISERIAPTAAALLAE